MPSSDSHSSSLEKLRAVFFDRDGTLIYDEPYNTDPKKVRLYPGVREGLSRLKAQGWLIVVVTNQSGIGRGLITEEQYQAVNAEFARLCGGPEILDAVYHAPERPDAPGSRRKPAPGMLLEAAERFEIDLSASWMIGDKPADVEAGQRAGCRVIRVLQDPATRDDAGPAADFTVGTIREAFEILLGRAECA